jgi:hypothetical protein
MRLLFLSWHLTSVAQELYFCTSWICVFYDHFDVCYPLLSSTESSLQLELYEILLFMLTNNKIPFQDLVLLILNIFQNFITQRTYIPFTLTLRIRKSNFHNKYGSLTRIKFLMKSFTT